MDPVQLVRHGAVAVLSLNRPSAGNAVNHEMAGMLRRLAEDLAAQDRVRAVILRAEGDAFSTGCDIVAMLAERGRGDSYQFARFCDSLVCGLHGAIRALRAIPAPLIGAVQGRAESGGMSLVLACDLVFASPHAVFHPGNARIGLSADGGLTWTLPRVVGAHRTMQMLIENRAIDAAEAKSLGFVADVLDGGDFDAQILARAEVAARLPRRAMIRMRQLIEAGAQHGLSAHLDLEQKTIGKLLKLEDVHEGLDAFAANRSAVFND